MESQSWPGRAEADRDRGLFAAPAWEGGPAARDYSHQPATAPPGVSSPAGGRTPEARGWGAEGPHCPEPRGQPKVRGQSVSHAKDLGEINNIRKILSVETITMWNGILVWMGASGIKMAKWCQTKYSKSYFGKIDQKSRAVKTGNCSGNLIWCHPQSRSCFL